MINKKVILAYKVGFSDTEVGKKKEDHTFVERNQKSTVQTKCPC